MLIDGRCVARLLKRSPELFLARLPVLMEGETEVGAIPVLLGPHVATAGDEDPEALGFAFVDGNGQPGVLEEAAELLKMGLRCGLFVDNEDAYSGSRAKLAADPNCAIGAWEGVTNIEQAVAEYLAFLDLDRVLTLAARINRKTEESLRQVVCECAGSPGKLTLGQLSAAKGEPAVRKALGEAMANGSWFKSQQRGAELGQLLLDVGVPPEVDAVIKRFHDAARTVLNGP